MEMKEFGMYFTQILLPNTGLNLQFRTVAAKNTMFLFYLTSYTKIFLLFTRHRKISMPSNIYVLKLSGLSCCLNDGAITACRHLMKLTLRDLHYFGLPF